MTDVLVLTAIEFEARGLARELELPRLPGLPFPVYERTPVPSAWAPDRVRLRVAPVGFRAALLADRWTALAAGLVSPLVISAGSCGALVPELEAGGLVIPESVMDPDGRRLSVTPEAHAVAVRLAKGGGPQAGREMNAGGPQAGREMDDARTGLLLTSREVVTTPEAKALRWRETGAIAVDMESAVVVAWATRQGCRTLVVRAVSDTASQRVPLELAGLMTPEGKLRAGRAVALALTHPRTIPHALVLRQGTGLALKRIARLLAALPD